jgi:hypothetical protein
MVDDLCYILQTPPSGLKQERKPHVYSDLKERKDLNRKIKPKKPEIDSRGLENDSPDETTLMEKLFCLNSIMWRTKHFLIWRIISKEGKIQTDKEFYHQEFEGWSWMN